MFLFYLLLMYLKRVQAESYKKNLRQYRIIIVVQMCRDIFRQVDKSDAGILTYFKELLAKMTENIGTDARQRRQPLIVRCCLKNR